MGRGTQITLGATALSLAAGTVGWWLASKRFAEGTGSYVARPGEIVTVPASMVVEPIPITKNARTERQRTYV